MISSVTSVNEAQEILKYIGGKDNYLESFCLKDSIYLTLKSLDQINKTGLKHLPYVINIRELGKAKIKTQAKKLDSQKELTPKVMPARSIVVQYVPKLTQILRIFKIRFFPKSIFKEAELFPLGPWSTAKSFVTLIDPGEELSDTQTKEFLHLFLLNHSQEIHFKLLNLIYSSDRVSPPSI